MVPKHIWSTGDAAKDPVQYQDADPVGTGPFMVNPCNPNLITYTANTKYWQPGLPHIAKVLYPAYTDNDPANLDLANDKAQWGSQYIPGMDQFYVAPDKENHHVWLPPTVNVELFFNLKHDVTGMLPVRQAFAYGIDREAVSTVGEGGLQPPANQAGIVLPTFKDWYDDSTKGQYNHDPEKAKAALADAGYSPSHPLELEVITISGYTDWDASLAEIKQELEPLGIKLTINDLAQTTYNDKLFKGDFDLAYGNGSIAVGPSPYYELRQLLYSANSAPLGENASTNYERYSDPATDALFDQFASADDATQHEIVKKLQQVMLTVIPIVPTTESVDWYQYNTKEITGWPTPDDPYARPAAYAIPDWGQVLLHLQHK
jgi:peptide/nickel transport system substrate-binding protein